MSLLFLFLFGYLTSAIDPSCYNIFNENVSPVKCPSTSSVNLCFIFCGICTTPELRLGLDDKTTTQYCNAGIAPDSDDTILTTSVNAIQNISELQGFYWEDEGGPETNATDCLKHLFHYMPRRDLMKFFSNPFDFLDFLLENIRYALLARQKWPAVPWDIFLDNVLPYSFFNENIDQAWRWRPRFYQIFSPLIADISNLTAAVQLIADGVPQAQALGALAYNNELVPGPPITWVSESSPAMISVRQVAQHGGSCTGTGIVFGAALRALGLPARMVGCSQNVPNDDHHWVEYWDNSTAGPFGDYWHTKEGESTGNTGGPWDSPSPPMNGCLADLVPGDQLNTIWATSWSSSTFLPTLWHQGSWAKTWGFVGGLNRCGVYCTAWGCGTNQTQFYNQDQCAPKST